MPRAVVPHSLRFVTDMPPPCACSVALALRVARGLRRGHVDRVHAGIAALVLMKRGDEGALAGVYALTHSTAGEVAGVVAAARALADVLAALRKGPLGRLREAQEEMLRPSWVVAKSVAAEATRPRPEYGQHRAAPAQEGAGQAPTAADAAEDRVRVMNCAGPCSPGGKGTQLRVHLSRPARRRRSPAAAAVPPRACAHDDDC